MTKTFVFAALLPAACIAAATFPQAAEAKDPGEIFSNVLKNYKTVTSARKNLRRKEKKGQSLTGDEYYVMAYACGYEESPSQSMIMTALSRSRCQDKVFEYYVEAGRRGSPEGFVAAARRPEAGSDAYFYAQLAYQFSAGDPWLSNEAIMLLADLRKVTGDTRREDARARQYAQQLVDAGAYTAAGQLAGAEQLAQLGPALSWLDFENPKRCGWSQQAVSVFQKSVGFDDKARYSTIPARVRIPGVPAPVLSRVSRPDPAAEMLTQVDIDFRGHWNGLSVVGLTHSFLEESHGYDATGIRFSDPLPKVIRTLQRLGFIINENGATREQIDKRDRYGNIDGVITMVKRENGETIFLCDEVYYASYGG